MHMNRLLKTLSVTLSKWIFLIYSEGSFCFKPVLKILPRELAHHKMVSVLISVTFQKQFSPQSRNINIMTYTLYSAVELLLKY